MTQSKQSNIDSIAKAAKKISKKNNRCSRIADVIDELLTERQQLLVCFTELASLDSQGARCNEVLPKLKEFNQWLVDYSALGHFEIYNQIIEDKERRDSVLKIAEQVYGDIEKTTEMFVAFNDKYDGADCEDSMTALHADLSEIGECMALRIDGEDNLLKELTATA